MTKPSQKSGHLSATRYPGPLFIGQQGKHISPRAVQHIFRNYAPPGITPHKIRHSYASELYRRSKNLRVVQENLGHYLDKDHRGLSPYGY